MIRLRYKHHVDTLRSIAQIILVLAIHVVVVIQAIRLNKQAPEHEFACFTSNVYLFAVIVKRKVAYT
ncbi:Uncharacterised protein [Chlamydia trachomatis]|nr:Uncharacterised protein [Chlamydia trachomatis]